MGGWGRLPLAHGSLCHTRIFSRFSCRATQGEWGTKLERGFDGLLALYRQRLWQAGRQAGRHWLSLLFSNQEKDIYIPTDLIGLSNNSSFQTLFFLSLNGFFPTRVAFLLRGRRGRTVCLLAVL